MTNTASTMSAMSPAWVDWNTCAVPEKPVEMSAGRVRAASCDTAADAGPSATPGRRLNDIVTDGTWPEWLTDVGPALRVSVATVPSAMSVPFVEGTYSCRSDAMS